MSKFKVILATSRNHILGNNNLIPWSGKYPTDVQFFKKLTSFSPFKNLENIVIMGRKTWESLPPNKLPGRIPIIISNTLPFSDKYYLASNLDYALHLATKIPHNEIWVIGGKQVYTEALTHYKCDKIYHNIIPDEYEGDTSLEIISPIIVKQLIEDKIIFNQYQLKGEFKYLHLLSKILNEGEFRQTRNANTWSLFNQNLEFDMKDGFPLLTTKKMFWKGIVEELLFFIRGHTNSKLLEEKGVNIWKGNTSKDFITKLGLPYEEGDMGKIYGFNWRHFGADYINCNTNYTGKGFDQLVKIIEEIKTNPSSRRILMSDFDPATSHQGVLYPCHSLVLQFYVRDEDILDVKMYQRSVDSFLGLPFNISSTSLLLHIISKLTNKTPGKVSLSLGDCHIYETHRDQVIRQLKRLPYNFPKLILPDFTSLDQVENSTLENYVIENYLHHKGIKAEMIA
ncbi:putative bifunctional dihydrofolate reductase/thymidylate synthase [Cafeteria roenbergensis virus]|uniref:thymidylate synthase n=1 Tax=Cafeteria roenbergensis virus (strain BV-PW1) TaxID=693272 RepID=E3T5S3_CROVB|nr:dihydrofolate reductase [Cafeteria roenbergensis virus BV-PW1]ADO67536.1 putative bifunctional dihydrofolate reductase/thymidylate synthase [Cafeteria roenbergensis virus BV-PW1]